MIRKLLLIPAILVLMLFSVVLKADAYIQNEIDLHLTIHKLYELRTFDTMKLINKSELIGNRLDNFNSARMVYNSSLEHTYNQLLQLEDELVSLNHNDTIDPQLKEFQMQRIFHDANTAVTVVNNQAGIFIQTIQHTMPTLTYQNYRKKFWEFYNSVGL